MSALELICDASLPSQTIPFDGKTRQGIGGAVLKAVLLTLWRFEGQPVSVRAVADRASCSETSAWRAILALRRMGLVEQVRVHQNHARSYHIDVFELRRYQCSTPLQRTRWTDRPSKRKRRPARQPDPSADAGLEVR